MEPLEIIRSWGENPRDGISDLVRDRRVSPTLSLPCEKTAKRWLSASQEEGPQQEPNQPATRFWTARSPQLWKINVCCLSHPAYGTLLRQPEQTNTVDLVLKPLAVSMGREGKSSLMTLPWASGALLPRDKPTWRQISMQLHSWWLRNKREAQKSFLWIQNPSSVNAEPHQNKALYRKSLLRTWRAVFDSWSCTLPVFEELLIVPIIY